MGIQTKFSKETKLNAIKEYHQGLKSTLQIAKELSCNKKTVMGWLHNYNNFGEKAFDEKLKLNRYSKELKLQAIHDYLNGLGSLQDITNKYKICSKSILLAWVLKYNSHKEITGRNSVGGINMTEFRKTTFEERLEIVKYCLENKSYNLAVEKYKIPYNQVYSWVKKYSEKGEFGLSDKRGRKKLEEELTEIDKLKRENESLKAKALRLEIENELLKKLEEIERREALIKSDKKQNMKR